MSECITTITDYPVNINVTGSPVVNVVVNKAGIQGPCCGTDTTENFLTSGQATGLFLTRVETGIFAISTNLNITGSNLYNLITGISGLANSSDILLNNKINSLSGYVNSTFLINSGVKIYRALLNQLDINAPVATVLENSLGGNVVWSYENIGEYRASLTNAFPASKTFVTCGTIAYGLSFGVSATAGDNRPNSLEFWTQDESNGTLQDTAVEILVYP